MRIIALILTLSTSGWASGLPDVKEVLRSTGRTVETFWEQFAAVDCKESVSQVKLDNSGKVIHRNDAAFDYLVLMRRAEGDLAVEESRIGTEAGGKQMRAAMLVTSGFSLFLLVFHPDLQHSFEFSQPAVEEMDGRGVLRVDFRQIRNARALSCLRLRGRDYPIQWTGTAWIEPRSGAIVKIKAALGSSMEDLGLKSLSAEVAYAPVKFIDTPGEQWLPAMAIIEAATPAQRWRNTHRFANYRRFSVNTSTKTEAPE